jgi:hypothetical protein
MVPVSGRRNGWLHDRSMVGRDLQLLSYDCAGEAGGVHSQRR